MFVIVATPVMATNIQAYIMYFFINKSFSNVIVYLCGFISGVFVYTVIPVFNFELNTKPVRSQYTQYEIFREENNVNQLETSSGIDPLLDQYRRNKELPLGLVQFPDKLNHKDEDKQAKQLYNDVKVLIWVMTSEEFHQTRAIHVKNTWGKRCNKLLFMSDAFDRKLPAIAISPLKGREHLTSKTMNAFDFLHQHFLKEYDWFMKVDDDTYVIVENLRYMLSSQNPHEPVFFGHHFKTNVKQGYFSGGGGYVISREALRRFGERNDTVCLSDGAIEDVDFATCMQTLGVVTGDSRDALNRSRFHCFPAVTHLRGYYPDWYLLYDKYNASKGRESMSDYAITFHYITPEEMNDMEYFVYHLRPYGIVSGTQDLNKRKLTKKKVLKPQTFNIKNSIITNHQGVPSLKHLLKLNISENIRAVN